MDRTAAFALVGVLAAGASSARAADRGTDAADVTTVAAADAGSSTKLAGDTDWTLPPVEFGANVPDGLSHGGSITINDSRPMALPFLYASFVALQGYDAYTTLHGSQVPGVHEANPVLSGVSGNSAGMLAVKGGATVASIYLAERLWHQHRRGEAIALMIASNGVMAAVAAHNASILRAQP